MKIFGYNISKDINKRNCEVTDVTSEQSATSLLFKGFQFQAAATTLSSFYGAMELIANSIAQLPILIKRDNEIDKNHPLNFLFKNGLISKFNLIKSIVTDIINYGNAYCYIERAQDGTPINLVYCQPTNVTVDYNDRKQELYYQIPMVKRGRIEAVNVLHFYKNSYNGVLGRSLVSYAKSVLDLAQATDKAAQSYYGSGCSLHGALTIKSSRRGAKEQARQAFESTHNGKGSGLVILDDDMSYQQLSSNANDSQMLEARTFNVSEIARYFNINPILLGDAKGKGYATIEAANIEFVSHTLLPYITMMQDEMNRKLVKPSESNIEIDIDETYLVKGDEKTESEYLTKLVAGGIMTINEARNRLGLNKVDGGDEIILAYSKIEDNKITDNVEDNTEEDDGERI